MGAQLWLSMDIKNSMEQNQIAYWQSFMKTKVHGDWEQPTAFHITLDFLGEDETDFQRVVEAMHLFEDNNDKYNQYVFAHNIGRFDGGAMWMGVDDSMKLYDIRYQMREYYKQVGYTPAPDKFKGYTPHITLAYNTPKDFDYRSVKTSKIPILVSNVTLWNSFKVNGEYVDNVLYSVNLTRH